MTSRRHRARCAVRIVEVGSGEGERIVTSSDWEKAYEAARKRRDRFVTLSFEDVPPLGLADRGRDLPRRSATRVRSPTPAASMRRDIGASPGPIRQFAGFAGVADTNQRFRHLLAQGQHGLSVAFDMPTLMGIDSDADLALGEVGHCGVAVDSADDMVACSIRSRSARSRSR